MIKKYTLLLVAFICIGWSTYGQGSESFTNCNAVASYTDGSYLGDNGITWTYVESRNEGVYPITDKGLMLRRQSNESKITSSPVPNGIGSFTCRLLKGFTGSGNRQVELFVNGISQGRSIAWDNTEVQTFTINTINISGDVVIEIRNITAYQVVIDDISWTAASTSTVEYCNLQWPENGNIATGNAFDVYAQVYETGVTEAIGPDPRILAWIGYSNANNPPHSAGWTWLPATFNAQHGNNDEYVTDIGMALPSGTYYYASRFQIDGGPYRYGGYHTTGGGFWDGTSNLSGILSVSTVDFCNLQFPTQGTINLGDVFDVYGQVYEQDLTPGPGQGFGIVAEVGYSATNSNPNTWTNWIPATYNGACLDCNDGQNDEYSANLGNVITNPGTYFYATRFRLHDGIWLYGGILADGSGGGFWDGTTYISGILNVMAPEIRVEGNQTPFLEITNGEMNPLGLRNTLFAAQFIGASQTKSYRIWNLGNLDLTLSNVAISGANPDDFTITVSPDTTIPSDQFTILEIQFSPLAAGVRNAIVSIENNDPNESPYTFAIRGTGLCVAETSSATPTNGPIGTVVTVVGANFGATTLASMNGIIMATTIINSTTIEVTIPANVSTGHIVVVNSIGCTYTIPFHVLDHQIGGCEGSNYLSDLFISEVTDATAGGLSYIEIYNGTGTTVPLGDYAIGIYSNGSSDLTRTIPLNAANLTSNSTYVIAIGVVTNPSSSNTCPQTGGNGQLANQTSSAISINKKDNEHDMIRLLKSGGAEVVDEFGVYMDNTWMDGTLITGDRGFNFRRLNTASTLPNPTFNLNDWNAIDWVGSGPSSCGTNDYSDIGHYDYSGSPSPTVTLQPIAPSSDCVLAATLTVSGAEGVPGGLPLSYQWYLSAPETQNWIEILATDPEYSGQQTHTLDILTTLHLDGYQYYAQIRENTSTCYIASNAVSLTINQTAWDGFNWTPSIPDQHTMAILNGNYTTNSVSGSFTSCSLVVNSGFTLNITDNYSVEVLNDVIVHGNSPTDHGTISVATKAAFVQRGDNTNSGTFVLRNSGTSRVEKTTALKQNWYDYTYWSTPVTNETVESVLNMASPGRRFYFEAANYEDVNGDDVDDNGDDWQLATGRMIPGVGYASTSNQSGTFPRTDMVLFNGEFNTGDISVTIHTNTVDDNDWNFIGNPYPSAIDFKSIYNENSTVIDGAAYLWSHHSPPSDSNPGNQLLNFSGADYAIISTGSGNTAGASQIMPSDFIPSGQSFFVKGLHSGGTLTFKNSMRMADANSNSQFFRNDTTEVPNKFWINLTSDNGIFNQILVAYVEGATDGVDRFAYDAERNLSTGLSAIIYTEIPESPKKYAIQGKAIESLTIDEEVSLGFKTSIIQPTIYTLSIAQFQGQFFDDNHLYLKDKVLNTHHNLSMSDYHFTSATGEFNNRFTIVFKNETLSTTDYILDAKDVSIMELNNGQVQFSVGPHLRLKSVELMDMSGRRLNQLEGIYSTEIYDLSHLSHAAYMARIELSNGQIITKRFIMGSKNRFKKPSNLKGIF